MVNILYEETAGGSYISITTCNEKLYIERLDWVNHHSYINSKFKNYELVKEVSYEDKETGYYKINSIIFVKDVEDAKRTK